MVWYNVKQSEALFQRGKREAFFESVKAKLCVQQETRSVFRVCKREAEEVAL